MAKARAPEAMACSDRPSRSGLDCSIPLRSARSHVDNSRSPFYKRSAELSLESLRIPGSIPFLWEQVPGRCKKPSSTTPVMHPDQQERPVSPTAGTTLLAATDAARHSLSNLFRQSSLNDRAASASASSSAVEPIAQPPAIERPRCSSSRHSAMHHDLPASSLITPSRLTSANEIADALSDSVSDVFTATAGAVSVDDSVAQSDQGRPRPASTPSAARDFIMNRFLPAAHTIACDSPQTPSKRFLGLPITAGHPDAATACCSGSFRDYGRVACVDSTVGNGSSCKTVNCSLCASSPVISTQRRQVPAEGSFHSAIDEFHDDLSEVEEEEPPSISKSCGILPFRIQISIYTRRSANRECTTSNHPRHKNQTKGRKGSKLTSHLLTSKRNTGVLREEEASGYDSQSLVQHVQSIKQEAEREKKRGEPSKQTQTLHYGSPYERPCSSSDRYYRKSLKPHQSCALCSSDFNNDEASKYGSYDDASSRFCSPSPAGLHCANVRALPGNCVPVLTENLHGTRTCAGLMVGSPHPALTCAAGMCLCHYGFCCCYTRNSTPHSYQIRLSSPSSYLTPPPSHPSSSHDGSGNQDIAIVNNGGLDVFSCIHRSEQQGKIINNALYEQEDRQTTTSSDLSCPCSKISQPETLPFDGTGVCNSSKAGSNGINWKLDATDGTNTCKISANFPKKDEYMLGAPVRDKNESNLRKLNSVSNNDSRRYEHKDDINDSNAGDAYKCYELHHPPHCHINCMKSRPHACLPAHHTCHGMHSIYVHTAMNDKKSGDVHDGKEGTGESRSSRMAPPLPKSPTHSWLGRTMPLVASTACKSPSRSSRFSKLLDRPAIAATSERAGSLQDEHALSHLLNIPTGKLS